MDDLLQERNLKFWKRCHLNKKSCRIQRSFDRNLTVFLHFLSILWKRYHLGFIRIIRINKKSRINSWILVEVPPGFEPGIEVLQTFALPLGYGTKFNCFLKGSDSKGIWTPVTAVKGRCLNRLTMEPDIFVLGSRSEKRTPPVGLEPTTLRLTAACSTDWAKEDYLI